MTRWFTADLHLGHTNIIRFCRRPFADVEDMDEGLVLAWNAVVEPDDEVWILGDLAMGKIADTLQRVKLLKGRKLLVPGNHDRCFVAANKGRQAWTEMYEAVGLEIKAAGTTVELAGNRVLMDHFPYTGDSGDQDRFAGHRLPQTGQWLLHGHCHDKWRQNGRMINVGVDAWAGRPVSEETLAGLITAGPANLEPLEWQAAD